MSAPQKWLQGRRDALSLHIRAMDHFPLLTACEEIALARQVQKILQLLEVKRR
jgi:hypothetical protein